MPTYVIPFAGTPAPQQFIISPHFPQSWMGQRKTHVNYLWSCSTPFFGRNSRRPQHGIKSAPGPMTTDRDLPSVDG